MSNRRRTKITVDMADMPLITIANDREWEEIQEMYSEALSCVSIPVDLDANDILRINSLVDQIYGQARFDHAHSKIMLKKYDRDLSNAKKTLRLTFKKERGQTADEREALIYEFLTTKPLPGHKEPIFTLVNRWEEREIFMEAVIDNLNKITDKLINGNGALKLNAQGRGDNR